MKKLDTSMLLIIISNPVHHYESKISKHKDMFPIYATLAQIRKLLIILNHDEVKYTPSENSDPDSLHLPSLLATLESKGRRSLLISLTIATTIFI